MTRAMTPSPYPGPRPFGAGEAQRFFGRDREIRDVTAMIVAYPVVLLYAPSGTGKTSLLQAGVLPRLVGDKHADVLPAGRVRGLGAPPAGEGNVFVANLLANWRRDGSAHRGASLAARPALRRSRPARGAPARPRHEAETIAEHFGARERARTPEGLPALRVVVIDQLEELLTLHPEHWAHREGFFAQLGEALARDELLHVVLGLREDFVAQLDRYAPLLPDRLRARFRLERLGPDAALEAAARPMESVGRHYAAGVGERLVDDLREFRVAEDGDESVPVIGEFVEPVQLQLACAGLWAQLPPDAAVVTHEHLDALGPLDHVLSRFYDDAIAAAAARIDTDARDLRVWFERELITPLGTRGLVLKTRQDTAGMPNAAVEELERRRLIRVEERAGAQWYELTHDRLIRPVLESNRHALAAGAGACDKPARRAARALAGAERARASGRLDAAERSARTALSLYEASGDRVGTVDALIALADIGAAAGRSEDSLARLRSALELERAGGDRRGLADMLARIAACEDRLGRPADAVATLCEAAGVHRSQGDAAGEADVAAALADVLVHAGDAAAARVHAGRAVELARAAGRPAQLGAMVRRLGVVLLAAGDDDGALRELERARGMSMDAGDWRGAVEALGAVVWLHRRRGRAREASGAAETWLALAERLGDATSQAAAHAEIAAALAHLDDHAGAVAHLDRAIALEPAAPALWRERAAALWNAGDARAALLDYSNALVQDPDDVGALCGRAQVLAEIGESERALEDVARAAPHATDAPTESAVHAARGLALARRGELAEALAALERAVALRPGSATAHFNRAVAYELAGEPSRAQEEFAMALRVDDPPLAAARRAEARARAAREPEPATAS